MCVRVCVCVCMCACVGVCKGRGPEKENAIPRAVDLVLVDFASLIAVKVLVNHERCVERPYARRCEQDVHIDDHNQKAKNQSMTAIERSQSEDVLTRHQSKSQQSEDFHR